MTSNADQPASPVIKLTNPRAIAQGRAMGSEVPRSFVEYKGLTKREHFAAMAMQGMVSTVSVWHINYELLAIDAVEMANALLKALEAK